MIEIGRGNLLTADVEAIVNTVNTVGVMGKGIALQVKRAFPEVYTAYRAACDRGEVRLGQMFVHDRGVLGAGRYIIDFPTKGHWRSRSRLADVESGLTDLVRVVEELGLASIAVPALGCGNGGLAWDDVRPRIERAFEALSEVRVVLFPPAGAPDPTDMPTGTPRPALTSMRALLLLAMAGYADRAATLEPREPGISELETQKLAYFLQQLGASLRLEFTPARYGPYAERLPQVLTLLEGHHIWGYGDRSAKVLDLAPLTVTPQARAEAQGIVGGEPELTGLLDRLADLTDGFETPYSMELLGTVHMAAHASPVSVDVGEVRERVTAWTQRKARLFTEHHVAVALERLADRDLLPAQTPGFVAIESSSAPHWTVGPSFAPNFSGASSE